MKIDQIDARILEVVQRNNQLSGEKIGEIVGLSASSVQRRINRLRRDKVIEADVSIVSPAVTGHPISMLLLVSLKHGGVRVVDHFRTAIRSAPEVMLSFYVTGEVDFVVLVTARTLEEYETSDLVLSPDAAAGNGCMYVSQSIAAGGPDSRASWAQHSPKILRPVPVAGLDSFRTILSQQDRTEASTV